MYQRGSINETEDFGALWRIFISATSLGKDEVAEQALARLDALKMPGDSPATDARRFRAVSDGDYKTALALAPKVSRTRMDVARRATYTALASGDPALKAAALAAIARVREDNKQEVHAIRLFAALGEIDSAFALLEDSRRRGGSFSGPGRFPGMANPLLWEPSLAPLWRDPRFAGYLTRAGFIAYWRGSKSRPDICKVDAAPPFCRLLERPAANPGP